MNLNEYGKVKGNEQSYFKGVFAEPTITDSAAEPDNDDNADDRWWLRR